MEASTVLDFWFKDHTPKDWWSKSEIFDDKIRAEFLVAYEAGAAGEFWHWRDSPEGRLAEIILLDQFPRNMFRESARAFEADTMALALSQEAVRAGALDRLNDTQKPFLILPYMHSESLIVHEESVRLFKGAGLDYNLEFEYRHKVIIERFGRYPHRNEALNRKSTVEELAFLKEPGSSF